MESEAGRLLVEAPYEGVKISDISTLYPKQSISDLQEHKGRTMVLNYQVFCTIWCINTYKYFNKIILT